MGAGSALAVAGGPGLDALDVSAESFRLAAGLVLGVEGLYALVLARPALEPELPGHGAALVPLAFPLLLRPGVVTLAVSAGGDGAELTAIGALAVALSLAALAGALGSSRRSEALLVAGGRLLGALEVAAGVALAVDAIREV